MPVFKIRVFREQSVLIEALSLSVLTDALTNPLNLDGCFEVDPTPETFSRLDYAVIAEQPEGTQAQMFEREGLLFHVDSAVPADPDPKDN
jgi:hypothetical protein